MKETLKLALHELRAGNYLAAEKTIFDKLWAIENPKSKPKPVSVFDFCKERERVKEDLRPALCGVYHENGVKVASDGFKLLCVQSNYPPDREGRIYDKEGVEIVGGGYPNYKAVIPHIDKCTHVPILSIGCVNYQATDAIDEAYKKLRVLNSKNNPHVLRIAKGIALDVVDADLFARLMRQMHDFETYSFENLVVILGRGSTILFTNRANLNLPCVPVKL